MINLKKNANKVQISLLLLLTYLYKAGSHKIKFHNNLVMTYMDHTDN